MGRKPLHIWTKEEDALLAKMRSEGRNHDEMVNYFPGKNKRNLIFRAHQLKLPPMPHCGGKRRRSPETIALAHKLRNEGRTWREVGDAIGVHYDTVKHWAYYYNETPIPRTPSCVKVDRDAAALAKQIPEDTRTLTGRLCGDPLPGRDALSMRQS